LLVEDTGTPVALYARGRILEATEHMVVATRELTRTFSAWREEASAEEREVAARASAVARLAPMMLALGHGGMILVLSANEAANGLSPRYECGSGADRLALAYEKLMHDAKPNDRLFRLWRGEGSAATGAVHVFSSQQIAYDEAAAFAARLTGIDGALQVNTELMLTAFGVKVSRRADESQYTRPVRLINPYTAEERVGTLEDFPGTRHRAGATFCMNQTEATAIIASQDGRLTLAVKRGEDVVVIGPYEYGFGWA